MTIEYIEDYEYNEINQRRLPVLRKPAIAFNFTLPAIKVMTINMITSYSVLRELKPFCIEDENAMIGGES